MLQIFLHDFALDGLLLHSFHSVCYTARFNLILFKFAIRDFYKIRSICFICLLQSTVPRSADSAFLINSSASSPSSVGMNTVTFCIEQLSLWKPTLWHTGHSIISTSSDSKQKQVCLSYCFSEGNSECSIPLASRFS